MRRSSRSHAGQEMVEALFSVMAASLILTSAMVVFSGGTEDGLKDPGEEAYRILQRALGWEVWLEGDAIDLEVARGVDEDLLIRTLGYGQTFLLRFYALNGSTTELILERGESPEGDVSVLSSPVVFIVDAARTPGMLEVVA